MKLAEVADALGVTRTALYRRWETQHAFWADVDRYLALDHDGALGDVDRAWRSVAGPGPGGRTRGEVLEGLRLRIGTVQDVLHGDLRALVHATLHAYDDVPEIAAARRASELRRIEDLSRDLGTIVSGLGLRFAEPLDPFGAAVAVRCLADGLTVRAWNQPSSAAERIIVDDGDGPREWTPLAYATRALLVEGTTRGRSAGHARASARPTATAPMAPAWTVGQIEALEQARVLFLGRVDPAQPLGCGHGISALGQVTMASVARESRVSRRSVHNVWPSSDALRLDLLTALFSAEREVFARRLDVVVDRSVRPADRAADLVAALVRPAAPDQIWVGHARLAYLVDRRHPGVRSRTTTGESAIAAELEAGVARLWPTAERPSAGALSDRQLGGFVSCLADGANRLARTLPEAVANHRPGTGLAALVESLVAHAPAATDLHHAPVA